MSSRPPASLLRRLLCAGLLCAVAALHAADDPVAVFSQVFNGYTRTRLPDGSFKPETYGFAEGGRQTRAVGDPELDQMPFARIAGSVVGPLARLNYRMTSKPDETDLLILVFWGSTAGSRDHDPNGTMDRAAGAIADFNTRSGPEAEAAGAAYDTALWQLHLANEDRDRLDDYNARILGFTDSLERARAEAHMGFGQDLLAEISANRYYVVLQAYDFPTARKLKKLKPLWTARISIRESGNGFADALARMIASAAPYFGRDSGGLRRATLREGKVELGPLQIIEVVPPKP